MELSVPKGLNDFDPSSLLTRLLQNKKKWCAISRQTAQTARKYKQKHL